LFVEVFTSLAKDVQCRILLRVAETSTDVLQQCRLRLLIVERYTSQVPDQGVSYLNHISWWRQGRV